MKKSAVLFIILLVILVSVTIITAQENICNNIDDDINGVIDENCDNDRDGYVNSEMKCEGSFYSKISNTGDNVIGKVKTNGKGIINLTSGWNLVSFPVASNIPLQELIDNCKAVAYEYDSNLNDYVLAENINSGKAYWIYKDGAGNCNFDINKYGLLESVNVNMQNGWNLVPGFEDLEGIYNKNGAGVFWSWDGNYYQMSTSLDSTRGVWVYWDKNKKSGLFSCSKVDCDDENSLINKGICLPANNANKKKMSKYSQKEVFLISDKNWKDVLPLVPVTTWTQQEGDTSNCQRGYGTPNNVCVYPTLIWHDEESTFSGPIYPWKSFDSLSKSLKINGMEYFEWKDKFDADLRFDKEIINVGDKFCVNMFYVESKSEDYSNSLINIVEIPSNFISNRFELEESSSLIMNIGQSLSNGGLYFFSKQNFMPCFIWNNPISTKGFDIDSSIYFMQQFNTEKVKIIGNAPDELQNLLITEHELGAGLIQEQIKFSGVEDYLSYWKSYKDVVYVEDNYELALIASTYASLLNAPLIIQGTGLDEDVNFVGRNVICVGQVSRQCNENYNLEQLQQKYVDMTEVYDGNKTDKIILTNPNDLNIFVSEEFQPEKSTYPVYEIYGKTSLASPILASAKHEIIITANFLEKSNYKLFKDLLKSKISILFPEKFWNYGLEREIRVFNLNLLNIETSNTEILQNKGYHNRYLFGEGDKILVLEPFQSPKLFYLNENIFEETNLPTGLNKVIISGDKIYYSKNNKIFIYDIQQKSINQISPWDGSKYSLYGVNDKNIIWLRWGSSSPVLQKYDYINKESPINLNIDFKYSYGGKVEGNYFLIDVMNTLDQREFVLLEIDQNTIVKKISGFNSILTNGKVFFADSRYPTQQEIEDCIAQGFLERFCNYPNIFALKYYDISSGEIINTNFERKNLYIKNALNNNLLASYPNFPQVYLELDGNQILEEPLVLPSNVLDTFLISEGKEIIYDTSDIVKNQIRGFLSIFASPEAIEISDCDSYDFMIGELCRSLDQQEYADIVNDDHWADMFVGRIQGISSSDISSYIARDLFYFSMNPSNKVGFMASLANNWDIPFWNTIHYSTIFSNSGYESQITTSGIESYNFDPILWEEKELIYYADHGSESWSGISSSQIPLLKNSFVLSYSCLTCAKESGGKGENYNPNSFCLQAIRNGALGFIGSLSVNNIRSDVFDNTLNEVYSKNKTIGQAITLSFGKTKQYAWTSGGEVAMLLGDPTFKVSTSQLNEDLLQERYN